MNTINELIDQLAGAIAERVVAIQRADNVRAAVVYLTPAEMANRLKVKPKTLANLRSAGKGPPFTKVGGRVRYPVAESG